MTFLGDMKLKPHTAEEVTDCATPDGMRRRLQKYSYMGGESMVKAIFDAARYRGLSGEDTMTWLAFEALQGMERYKGMVLEQYMLNPIPPIIISSRSGDNGAPIERTKE